MVDCVGKVALPALGAGGRRFESFCPDLKIKELQGFVTPIFLLILKICTRFARKLSEMDKKANHATDDKSKSRIWKDNS